MIPWLAVVAGAIMTVEAAVRLPLLSKVVALRAIAGEVVATLRSGESDRRKQVLLFDCARRLLAISAALSFLALVVCLPVAGIVWLSHLAGYDTLNLSTSASGLAGGTVCAFAYAMLRRYVA